MNYAESLPDAQTRAAYASFLASHCWDCFITATFAHRVKYARQALEMVAHSLPHLHKAAIFAEPHRLGGYHCHALVDFTSSPVFVMPANQVEYYLERSPGSAQDSLRKRGFARVELVRGTDACSAYLTKYQTKAAADYLFLGDKYYWQGDVSRY